VIRGARPHHISAALALLFFVSAAEAQSRCETNLRATQSSRYSSAPLARAVTLHAGTVTLRTALERLASAAHVRLSYSPELLPLQRSVCVAYDGIAIGAVLEQLLQGTGVEAVSAAADHIVLTPSRARAADAETQTLAAPVITLEPVVAAASAAREPGKIPSYSLDVIDGDALRERSSVSLAQALNGVIPGLYAWSQSPTSPLTQYGSMRGASSLGLSYPKVYIDGIEVANPLLLTRISVDAIDRIEVIRGPQGAALYGSDAMGGVTNIITRHDAAENGARRQIRSGFGVSASDFVAGSTLGQDHTLSLRGGTTTRSAGMNVTIGSAGEYVPDAYARHLTADGSLRLVGERTLLNGTFRFLTQQSSNPQSPMLNAGAPQPLLTGSNVGTQPLTVHQYTAGIQGTYSHNSHWQHAIVLGVDGYGLGGVPSPDASPILSASDSALLAAGSSAWRATLRLSSSARFDLGEHAIGSLSFSAERSQLSYHGNPETAGSLAWTPNGQQPNIGMIGKRPSLEPAASRSSSGIDAMRGSSGLSTQFSALMYERFSLSTGIRLERNDQSELPSRLATLPMVGASWLALDGPLSIKLRSAYGKSIRWPDAGTRIQPVPSTRLQSGAFTLGPEEQAGAEIGLDLRVRDEFGVQITRFDQTASGLIHSVAIAEAPQRYRTARVSYELQNVGEIANQGWEIQASFDHGHLTLAGTLSLINSRVQDLAKGYTGDLRVGDRPLGVPARTIGLRADWTESAWSASVGAFRAMDWINYDRVAMNRAANDSTLGTDLLIGANLRAFWMPYSGFTHLRATATRTLRPGLSMTFTGENLLDYQLGEPDNITILPGRTLSVMLRASF
jgi:outer membrane receptor protein involved in Fe transport